MVPHTFFAKFLTYSQACVFDRQLSPSTTSQQFDCLMSADYVEAMNDLAVLNPDDPASLGWPPTLPIEVAMRTAPIKDICEAYELSRADWDKLRHDPLFIAEVAGATEALKKEGMSFRMKARLQSEELLKTSWKMIHASSDEVPPTVKADLIKFTIKAAGLSEEKASASAAQVGTALQININLG